MWLRFVASNRGIEFIRSWVDRPPIELPPRADAADRVISLRTTNPLHMLLDQICIVVKSRLELPHNVLKV